MLTLYQEAYLEHYKLIQQHQRDETLAHPVDDDEIAELERILASALSDTQEYFQALNVLDYYHPASDEFSTALAIYDRLSVKYHWAERVW